MAMIATNAGFGAQAEGLLARIGDAFSKFASNGHEATAPYKAARYAGALSNLSDKELSKRGLKRNDIVRHAFNGVPLY